MKSLLMMCCVALVLLLATAVHAAYDIESAKIVQSNAFFAESSVFLGQSGANILFGFKAKAVLSVTTNHSFRVRLPPHFNGDTLKNPSGITCRIETSAGVVVSAGVLDRITAYGTASTDLRCTPNGSFSLAVGTTYVVRFQGCDLKDNVSLTSDCDAGLLPSTFFPNPFAAFSGLFGGLWAATGSNCCSNAYFALFLSETCLDSFSNFDGCCNISRTGSCYGGCASSTTKFSGLTISATPTSGDSGDINRSKTSMTVTEQFTALVQIKGADFVTQSTHSGTTSTVPPYLRSTLPGYSATFTDASSPYTSNLQCVVSINGTPQTLAASDTDSFSPAVLARVSTSGDLIVYCALSKTINIPIGATITVVISNVISPLQGDSCTRSNAKTSTSSACCGGIVVALVKGNFDQTASVYNSLPAKSCPVFYSTAIAVQNANANEICRDLTFYPLSISSYASSTGDIAAGSTTGLVSNAYYRFLVSSAGLTQSSAFTLALPGFRILSTTNVKIHIIANDDDAQASDVTVVAVTSGTSLRLSGVLPFSLTVGSYYTIFFPELYATNRLPSSAQCSSQAVSGSATADAFCCQSFFIQFAIGSSSVFVYPSCCPIRPPGENEQTLGEYCLALEEDTDGEFDPACCDKTTPSDSKFFTQCVNYYCGADANPAIWIPGLCCNPDASTRPSERCCEGTSFCVQFCCGGDNPNPPPAHYPFVPGMCCAAKPDVGDATADDDAYYFFDIDGIADICQCYYNFDSTDYSETRVTECCTGDSPLAPRHPVCQCVILYDLLHPTPAPTPSLTAAQRNDILVEFMATNIDFDPKSCCLLSAHANSNVTPPDNTIPGYGEPADQLLGWLNDEICDCIAAGNIVGGTYERLDCCEYDYFSDNCPIACPTPPDCGCGNGCGSGSGCSCCKQNKINISSLKSGEDINISVGSNPVRIASQEL